MPDSTPEPDLLVRRDGQVAVVTLNRPERLNALSHTLLRRLRRTLTDLDNDQSVRAIVLTGAGRAFSAGADLRGAPSDAEQVVRELYNPLILEIQDMVTPMVAAVNGVAVGAAVSLACACDLRVAADTASFQLAFVSVGLVPDAGATWLLPRIVGLGRATELALLGRRLPAPEACDIGLVNSIVPTDQVVKNAVEIARSLADFGSSVSTTRRLLRRSFMEDLPDQLAAEAVAQGIAQRSPEYKEARRAFADKRRPTAQ
ncbi:enoyl-CoA hydratase/isomerase family protein [Nocardia sp. NPDC059239]|uniref:enoyl-CoA hydratase/isomerase family protein n=1 Tax=unclassified Nocardia TaxID=2637762 RepID=UPI0036AD7A5F